VAAAAATLVKRRHLRLAQVPVVRYVRSVLDQLLGHGQHELVAADRGAVERGEALGCAEHAGAHGHPGRLAAALVHVELADVADLAAVGVDRGQTDQVVPLLLGGCHDILLADPVVVWG
jgi:hypothetical protein